MTSLCIETHTVTEHCFVHRGDMQFHFPANTYSITLESNSSRGMGGNVGRDGLAKLLKDGWLSSSWLRDGWQIVEGWVAKLVEGSGAIG